MKNSRPCPPPPRISPARRGCRLLAATCLALLPSFGCGSESTVHFGGTVVVPADLTTALTAERAAVITVSRTPEHATVAGERVVVAVLCGPSATDVTVPFEIVKSLEELGCPGPATMLAEMVPIGLPPGSPCHATSAGDAPHVAAASAQAFAERASKAYCDGFGEEYRSTTTLRLAPAR